MQNAWVTWALPFGMMGFWIAAGLVELIRTPNPTHNSENRPSRVRSAADFNRPIGN